MPLSEHEERALAEIERRLYEDAPRFVATVSTSTVARVHLRRIRLAVVGFLAGLVLLLGLTFNLAFGVIGFALMLVSLIAGASAMRALSAGGGALAEELRRAFARRDSDV